MEPLETTYLKRYRVGLMTLWLGWALACCTLLGFGLSALSGRTSSLLTLRHSEALAISEELRAAFYTLEHLPHLLVSTARDLAETPPGLKAPRLVSLRQESQPFCTLYWLNSAGQVQSPGDPMPPPWLWQMAQRRLPARGSSVQTLRPLPPGWEAGRRSPQELQVADDTPEIYLAAAARTTEGDVLVATLDLAYVFGPWLKKRLERTPLGGAIQATVGSDPSVSDAPPAPVPSIPWPSASLESARWTWTIPTFFASTSTPFTRLTLHLDHTAGLTDLRQEMLGHAAVAVLVMGALAFSIALTGKAVRRELEYAQARTRFTAMVSHELRTPLAAISMYSEILREALIDDPTKIAAYHNRLAQEIERLHRLIEHVLTFSRLEGRSTPPEWQPIHPERIAQQAVATVAASGALIDVSVPPSPTYLGDPDLTVQILVNLLENAIKHNSQAQPLELACLVQPHNVVWEVRDRGPGIPADMRQKIFQPYTRILSPDGPKKSGLGLGLAVVDRLVRSLQGHIECRPRDGGGTVFTVTLRRKDEASWHDSS